MWKFNATVYLRNTKMVFLAALFVYMQVFGFANGQVVSGCPLYGCTPGGSFSLDAVLSSSNVEIAWVTKLENSSTHQINSQLGCVSNENNVVCPTNDGYVSIDPRTGKILWRRNMLHRPTLPIIDIYGDIIGSDGRSLVMIESDGTAQPAIQLNLPIDSIYSLNLLDNGAFLIVSTNGMVIAYLINGVPLGSMKLSGSMGGENGTFHPIASPVISGHRAYILTEFKAEKNKLLPNNQKFKPRLVAIDVNEDITDRLHIAWFLDLQDQLTFHRKQYGAFNPSSSHPLNFSPKNRFGVYMKQRYQLLVENGRAKMVSSNLFISNLLRNYPQRRHDNNNRTLSPSVLVQGDIVYVSLSFTGNLGALGSSMSKLIAIKDLHYSSEILFQQRKPLSHLSSIPQQFTSDDVENIIIWSAAKNNNGMVYGVDFMTGNEFANINLTKIIFGDSVQITSKLIVTHLKNRYVFSFGIRREKTAAHYLSEIEYDPKQSTTAVLSLVQTPENERIVGQVISVTFTDNKTYMLAKTETGSIFSLRERSTS